MSLAATKRRSLDSLNRRLSSRSSPLSVPAPVVPSPFADTADDDARRQQRRSAALAKLLHTLQLKDEEPALPSPASSTESALSSDDLRRERVDVAAKLREEQRRKRREAADQRQAEKDKKARHERARREAEVEQRRLEESKNEEEKQREELETRRAVDDQRRQQRAFEAEKWELACRHHALVLSIKYIWLPWRRYVDERRTKHQRAVSFDQRRAQRSAFRNLRRALQQARAERASEEERKVQRAEHFAGYCCMERAMRIWRMVYSQHRRNEKQADCFHRSTLMRHHQQRWLALTQQRLADREKALAVIELRAIAIDRRASQQRTFSQWLRFVAQQRDERAKQRMKVATWQKVNRWLNEFKSSSSAAHER